jgi:hypothetical protein
MASVGGYSAGPVLLSPICSSTNELKLRGFAFAHGTISVILWVVR